MSVIDAAETQPPGPARAARCAGARRAAVAALAGLALGLAAPPARSALRPQIARCSVPAWSGDPATIGLGNTPDHRKLVVEHAWAKHPTESEEQALASTWRVEVCWISPGGELTCPGTPDWVVYDRDLGIGELPSADSIKPSLAGAPPALGEKIVPLDWDAPADAGRLLAIVVNDEQSPPALPVDALREGGACPVISRITGSPRARSGAMAEGAALDAPGSRTPAEVHFVVYGVPSTFAAPRPAGRPWPFDPPCGANRSGHPAYGGSPCVDKSAVEFGRDLLYAVDDWQVAILQGGLPDGARRRTFMNGGPGGASSTCALGATCPTRSFWIPMSGAGTGSDGFNYEHNGPYARPIDPLAVNAGAAGALRNHAHEYFHNLQFAYMTEAARAGGQFLIGPEWEAEPTVMEAAVCVDRYHPALPRDKCVSAWTLGYDYGGLYAANDYLAFPHNPQQSYPGALFYRYAAEQFAVPRKLPGQQSHLPSAEKESVSPVRMARGVELPLNDRRPDEGLDLVGYLMAAADTSGASGFCRGLGPAASLADRFECAFRRTLGRGFDDLLFEFHTMLVLKDYPQVDTRWRLAWVGDYNAGARPGALPAGWPDPRRRDVRALKPFVKPPVGPSAGQGYPLSPDARMPDGLLRARREMDTYDCVAVPCEGANRVVRRLARGQTLSAPDVSLGRFGAAYLSVHPEPSDAALRVHARVRQGKPRFRLFAIDTRGRPLLHPACTAGKVGSEECPAGATGRDVDVDLSVSPARDVQELLLVASAGSEPAAFEWRMGPSTSRITIVSPTTAQPQDIGHGAGRRALVLMFTATDTDGTPYLGVTARNLEVTVQGTALRRPGACPGQDCPFALLRAAGGAYMAVVRVPEGIAVPADGRLDLHVGLSSGGVGADRQPKAIDVSGKPARVATQLLVDVSGSMAEGGRLRAAKEALALVADAHADGQDYVGLSFFSSHAQTLVDPTPVSRSSRASLRLGIQSLEAAGSTAIGDGLFEAQDALAVELDSAPADAALVRQGVILLTDGHSTCDWSPEKYIFEDAARDGDVRGCDRCECGAATVPWLPPWSANGGYADFRRSPLGFNARRAAGKKTPVISGVGLGPDADMGTINLLATATGGARFKLPLTGPMPLLSMHLADGLRLAENAISGHERVIARVTDGLAGLPSFAVDDRACELVVSVLAHGLDDPSGLQLLSPLGASVPADRASATHATFRVRAPAAGTWSWVDPRAGAHPESVAFVEAAVRSPLRLFAAVDAVGARSVVGHPRGRSFDDGRWAGLPLAAQAFVHDGEAPVRSARLSALVRGPDAAHGGSIELFDDGAHDDGAAGDGVFGGAFARTSVAGSYTVEIAATVGTGASAERIRRETRATVFLHDAPDADGDGLPDWWEDRWNTRGDVPSGDGDDDRDGLSNRQEWEAGTRPDASDSDGGGESDGSEVAAGRDPRSGRDDAVGTPFVTAHAGNGRVLLRTGLPASERMRLEVVSAPTPLGPFAPHGSLGGAQGSVVVLPADNGVRRCFGMRATLARAASGWSAPVCVVPRRDPDPPSLAIELEPGGACVRESAFEVVIAAADEPGGDRMHRLGRWLPDLGTVASGVGSMRVSVGERSVASMPWTEPRRRVRVVWNGGASEIPIAVQVRDRAGNESAVARASARRCDGSGLDSAITPDPVAAGARSRSAPRSAPR
jgi:Mg-chelatase subunit ChlD